MEFSCFFYNPVYVGNLISGSSAFSKSILYNKKFSVYVLLCLTPVTPWTVARQAPLSMEFSRQEYWSGLPCLPPGDLPNPGIEPRSPTLPPGSSPEGSSLCGSQMVSLPPSPPHQLPLWPLLQLPFFPIPLYPVHDSRHHLPQVCSLKILLWGLVDQHP